ncbi:MAG: hypothetical protein GY874_03715 [Desulfobacteraceae bacterium]|nr:hypothetical protein [Desulfobacteraceae bacterium]
MERLKKILTNSLLAFALISIGFALGKHSVKPDRQTDNIANGNGRQVVVYYLHSTFRCVTCNTIEKMTRELLDNSYSKQLADEKIQWIEDDFQENETLAKQFEVVASCVVVAEVKDGVVLDYKRLDDVWTKMKDPEAFNQYISDAINGYLKKSGG